MKNLFSILLLFLLPVCGFAEKTLQEKVVQALNDKTVNDPLERWWASYRVINEFIYAPHEEIMPVIKDIVLPFIEKDIKDNSKQYIAKAHTHERMSLIHAIRSEPEDLIARQRLIEKALEYAELSKDDKTCAFIYGQWGYFQSEKGSIPLAHEYFYKAINLYESLNDYNMIFRYQFGIAENLLQIYDATGLHMVVEQMQQNLTREPALNTPNNLYRFYSVLSSYYSVLSDADPESIAYQDSTLMIERKIIDIIENNRNLEIPAGFSYYNVARAYKKRYPEQRDSVYYFLDRALESKIGDRLVDVELEICVYMLYAEMLVDQKNYGQAEKDLLYVLSLLEEVNDHNSVVAEYSGTYRFLITCYEAMNRPWEVVKYQKLLLENEKRLYDNDKIIAMDDMLVKYEVEKHKEQIDRLAERNKAARKISVLAISLIVVLLIVLLILILLQKARKKNLEQSAYESALLAELKHSELEYIKQRLEQKPVKNMVKKLMEWISQSVLDKTKIKIYTQQLSELDVDMLEQGFLTAEEKISNMDMKYIICFAIEMDVKDMGLLFNVEPASIRTVRYRIKKKFLGKNGFIFLM